MAKSINITLEGDNTHLANFMGPLDENLMQIGSAFNVKVSRTGNKVTVTGEFADECKKVIEKFFRFARHKPLDLEEVQLGLVEEINSNPNIPVSDSNFSNYYDEEIEDTSTELSITDENELYFLRTRKKDLKPRTPRQKEYIHKILHNDISFGVGPAGTGKTWLAVACAVDALERDQVERIILTRPAVEAGERLGFLPGDLTSKVDPYLRPLYDALYDLMGFDKVQKLFEKQIIEIAPLAYMRGRTLNRAFVILDEAQNTLPEQMKMFLTRIGFGSKAVITGDPSQVDLQRGQRSGLTHALGVLKIVEGITFTHFSSRDVVRHHLVARIVEAYAYHEKYKSDK
ncbi:PhoH family protein [Taylorella equigenitalis]|uniref:PhoH family protein n=1 Tax=Taylorella equigenitalis TaxID=29575 RepID=UPI00237EC691|nr:PhoH family protein [Taylorella equigenitalis]WDU47651.1 PhoH family protein [Taylorella equigenitalis]